MDPSQGTALPDGFLTGPAPNPSKTPIDFAATDLPEYKGLYAVVLDGIMSPEECEQLVAAAQAHAGNKWERALVNIGNGLQAMYEDVRKCDRIIWDDRDVVAKIWARCAPLVPELGRIVNQPDVSGVGPARRREVWSMRRCNERMRILKYTSGEYFQPHCDGTYETPDGKERSYYTLHLYLNDTDHQPQGHNILKGGATTFWALNMKRRLDVQPKMGSVLIFQHRFLLHSGDEVVEGTKITLRTDLMYEKSDETAPEPEEVKPDQTKKRPVWVASLKKQKS